MTRVVHSIDVYLVAYGQWIVKHHPGPRWAMLDVLRRNLELWQREYGDKATAKVRDALRQAVKQEAAVERR